MFLASKNQIQLIILELSDLVTKQKVSATHSICKVGQPKSNYQRVMCQQPMKFFGMFDHNPPHTFENNSGKMHCDKKNCYCMTLSLKVKVAAKNKSQ